MNIDNLREKLQVIINEYENFIKNIDNIAKESKSRAYGGVVREGKGGFVENIAKKLVKIAWEDLGEDENRLIFRHQIIKIPIKKDYINRIKIKEIQEYIQKNINEMYYGIIPDLQVYIDDKFKISIECKAYTENAMFKRILVDATLIKQVYPDVKFLLLQLESQLGGDYSDIFKEVHYGSPSTHTLLSYFDIELNIITLLEGERKVDQPIHKYPKELKIEALLKAVEIIQKLLE